MPGIVGLVTRMPRERAEPQLHRMVDALRHESFYETGTFVDEGLGVYVGWIARKNSFAAGMPLQDERGQAVLVFSGEEYPAPGVAQRLKARGHALETDGPSYLVHLLEDDPAFPAALNGRFHGLAIDRARGTTTLFTDRYGMHPLCYHESREAFYFAAEAKAILEVCSEVRTVDGRSMGELVSCGCVLEGRTLFSGVHVLPPASVWSIRDGAIDRRHSYFRPQEWEGQGVLAPDAFYREWREVFARHLPRYFQARERIGMSLTGGLDTRMIMAWQSSPPGSLPCYSFGGMLRESQDVRVARQVAGACGQAHHEIPIGQEFLARFPHYAERTVYLTDGCAGVSHAADLYANERAAEIAPIRMTGNYGGEVLRQVRAFKPMAPAPGLFRPEFLPSIDAARATYAEIVRGHPLSFAVFRQAPWYHHGLLALEQTQVSLRTPYLDNDLVRTAFRAPASALAPSEVCLRLIADGSPALGRIRTDRGLAGHDGRVRAAVARAALELAFKAEYLYDYGMPQWLAGVDHLLSPFRLERLFLGRHKFRHFRVWYREALAGYVREMLLDPRALSRPYVRRDTVEAIVSEHLGGRRNHTSAIHTLLTLELLHRLFLDRPPAGR